MKTWSAMYRHPGQEISSLKRLQVKMLYFRVQEKPAFLDFFLQRARSENDLVYGGKAAQALDRGKRYHGIEAERIKNFVFFVQCDYVDRSVRDSGRHVVGNGPGTEELKNRIEVALQCPMNCPVAAKGFGELPPCFFEFFFPPSKIQVHFFSHWKSSATS
jgi:hypothetical protein